MSNLWMQTRSGIDIDLKRPVIRLADFEDLMHSIAGQPRYLNHTRQSYFVGEHCVRLSYILAAWGYGPDMQLRGLLHDLPEGILGDITAPVKALIREHTYVLDVIEERILFAILDCVGLPHMRSDPPMPMPEWEETQAIIKRADLVMLSTERRDHMAPCARDWNLKEAPLPKTMANPLTAEAAERAYMERFEYLQAKRAEAAPKEAA